MSSRLSEASWILDSDALEQALKVRIDAAQIRRITAGAPPAFRSIAHYAACWGISDDCHRTDLVRGAPLDAVQNLKEVVGLYEEELDIWLAGPEANGPHFSDAYVAFSCMRMAADEV